MNRSRSSKKTQEITSSRPAGLQRRKPSPLALEARLMFDGAAVATAIADTAPAADVHEAIVDKTAAAVQTDASREGAQSIETTPPREIAFIDTSVADWQTLAAGVTKPGVEIVLLDPAKDGLTQIADFVKGQSGLNAIHIVSHGTAGELLLGGESYTVDSLALHQEQLSDIGRALTNDGDILLYGCDIAAGSAGEAFVNAVAQATSADVAASSDITGIDGDWDLEVTTGKIDTGTAIDVAATGQYEHDLQTVNVIVTLDDTDSTFVPPLRLSPRYYEKFSFTVGSAGNYTISTSQNGGSTVDTYLYIYNGTFDPSHPGNNLVAWDNNSGNGNYSSVTSSLTTGVTYTVVATTDAPGALGSFKCSINGSGNIRLANEAPTITSSSAFTVAENSTAVGTVTGSDPEGSALTYSISGTDAAKFTINPTTGALSFNAAPNFEAPADTGQNNVYNFTVQATDGTNPVTQAVTVTVTNVNEAPTITSNNAFTVAENSTAVGTVTGSDPEGSALTYSISGTDAAKFTINPTTGALSFNAAPNFEAPTDAGQNNVYNFTVRATDGTNPVTQAVTVTVTNVNEAPTITSNNAFTVTENSTAVGSVTGSDPEGSSLTYSISGTDAAKFTINPTTGALSFNAAPNFEAPADAGQNNVYNFTVRATDGTNPVTQALTVTVTNVNEAPTITSNNAFTVAENSTAVGSVTGSDPEGSSLTYSISGTDAALFTINPTTGALSFNAAPNFEAPADAGQNNVYNFTVQATDGTNPVTQAVTISVTNVNEAPSAQEDTATTLAEDGVNPGNTPFAGTTNAIGNVLANDTDPDSGDSKTLTLVNGTAIAANGSTVINGTYGTLSIAANGSYTYTLDNSRLTADALAQGQSVSETFNYTMRDNANATASSTLTVTITGTNDAPRIGAFNADNAIVIRDNQSANPSPDTINVTGTEGAIEKVTVSLTLSHTWPADIDILLVGPNGEKAILMSDAGGGGDINNITLVFDDAAAQAVPFNAQLTSGTFRPANHNDNLGGDGFSGVPTGSYGSSLSVFNGQSANGTWSLHVMDDAGQDVGVISQWSLSFSTSAVRGSVTEQGNQDDGTVASGTPSATGKLTSSDIDANAVATWSIAGSSTFGSMSIDSTTGRWTYTLNNDSAATQALKEGDVRTETFTATVTDDKGATATQQITVTVNGTNDAPVVTSNAAAAQGTAVEAGSLDDGTAVAGTPSATGTLTARDVDATTPVSWSIAGTGTYGSIEIDAETGQWTYTLNNDSAATQALKEGDVRTETFTATVTDDKGATASQLITVTVNGTNDAPVVTSNAAAAQGTAVEAGSQDDGSAVAGTPSATGTLTVRDVDATTPVSWSIAGTGTYGSIEIDAETGQWTYTLNNDSAATQALKEGDVRTETFTATVTDDKGATATQLITVTVNGTNDAPVGQNDSATINEDTASVAIDVLANDTDVDRDALLTVVNIDTTDLVGSASVTSIGGGTETVATAVSRSAFGVSANPDLGNPSLPSVEIHGQHDSRSDVDWFVFTVQQGEQLILDIDHGTFDTMLWVYNENGTRVGYSDDNGGDSGSTSWLDSYVGTGPLAAGTYRVAITGYNQDPMNPNGSSYNDGGTYVLNASIVPTETSSGFGTQPAVLNVSEATRTGVVYTPGQGFQYLGEGESATETFSYTVSDEFGATDTQSVTVTIQGRNDAPEAVNDQAIAMEAGGVLNGTPGIDPTGNVLRNDIDVDATDTKSVVSVYAGTQGPGDKPIDERDAPREMRMPVSEDPGTAVEGESGTVVQGTYGRLTLWANGDYLYEVDNSNPDVQALQAEGESLTETFVYTISDRAGETSTATLRIVVTGQNDAPEATDSIANETLVAGDPYELQLPLDLFKDVDAGDGLTYTARLANGDPLPSWLTFDPVNQRLTGVANNSDVGALAIVITATDKSGATAEVTYTLNVVGRNTSTLSTGNTGTDGTPGTFNVSGYNGLNPGRTSGNLGNANVPDPSQVGFGNAAQAFDPNVLIESAPTAAGPLDQEPGDGERYELAFVDVNGQQDDLMVFVPPGSKFNFSLPAFLTEGSSQPDLVAFQMNGDALPVWLRFDPVTGKFVGKAPKDMVGTLRIQLTGKDAQGNERAIRISLTVDPAAERMQAGEGSKIAAAGTAEKPDNTAPRGRSGISEQIRMAAKRGAQADQLAKAAAAMKASTVL